MCSHNFYNLKDSITTNKLKKRPGLTSVVQPKKKINSTVFCRTPVEKHCPIVPNDGAVMELEKTWKHLSCPHSKKSPGILLAGLQTHSSLKVCIQSGSGDLNSKPP
jgi:hypothetical protein